MDSIDKALERFIKGGVKSSNPSENPELAQIFEGCIDRAYQQVPKNAKVGMETDYLDFEDIAKNILSRRSDGTTSSHIVSDAAQAIFQHGFDSLDAWNSSGPDSAAEAKASAQEKPDLIAPEQDAHFGDMPTESGKMGTDWSVAPELNAHDISQGSQASSVEIPGTNAREMKSGPQPPTGIEMPFASVEQQIQMANEYGQMTSPGTPEPAHPRPTPPPQQGGASPQAASGIESPDLSSAQQTQMATPYLPGMEQFLTSDQMPHLSMPHDPSAPPQESLNNPQLGHAVDGSIEQTPGTVDETTLDDPLQQLNEIVKVNSEQGNFLSSFLADPDGPEAATIVESLSNGQDTSHLDTALGSDDPINNGRRSPASPAGPDIESIRKDFPILKRKIHGKPLIWFDNGATTQKPQQVIDALSHFYTYYNSNVNRGAHTLGNEATDAFEGAREKAREFLGARETSEIIFVRGTTEGINLVAQAWGRLNIGGGDEIIISALEHHSNIVPWQMLADEKGAKLKIIPVDDTGDVLTDRYEALFTSRTKMVAFAHVSNTLGTVTPVQKMVAIAHAHGVPVLVDGAQAVAHLPVNVQSLDVDFYVFSSHKIFGPTGVGVLYGKREHLEKMPPWQGGGSMIKDVTFEETIYNDLPKKFEAGTPMIGPAIGLGVALEYVNGVGMERIEAHERALTLYAMKRLQEVPGIQIIGKSLNKIGVISFVIDGIAPERIGGILDRHGIAVRVGHHCALPILRRFGVEETVRVALAIYNTEAEIDFMIDVLRSMIR